LSLPIAVNAAILLIVWTRMSGQQPTHLQQSSWPFSLAQMISYLLEHQAPTPATARK